MATKTTKPVKKGVKHVDASKKKAVSSPKKYGLNKAQWGVVIAAIVVVAGIGAYFLLQQKQETTADASSCVSRTFRQGNSSVCIKYAQQIMNATPGTGADVSADSVFGPKTKAKVIRYQKAKKITHDGVIGSGTWSKLCYRGESTTRSSARKAAGCKETVRKVRKASVIDGKTMVTHLYYSYKK